MTKEEKIIHYIKRCYFSLVRLVDHEEDKFLENFNYFYEFAREEMEGEMYNIAEVITSITPEEYNTVYSAIIEYFRNEEHYSEKERERLKLHGITW